VFWRSGAETLGSFHYKKRRKSGALLPCRVHVFAMEVVRQRRRWPEKRAREICWCSLEETFERVTEPDFADLSPSSLRHQAVCVERRMGASTAVAN